MTPARPAAGPQKKIRRLLDALVESGIERGVQFSAYHEGRLLVDAAAGQADPFTRRPVRQDTLFPVFSVSKGISATVVHRLAERGVLSWHDPIARRWPEFAAAGKSAITLQHALRHLAGLPDLPAGLTLMQMVDWNAACAALAAARPRWRPGTRFAYHAKTYGWLIGESARRADGRDFSRLVREEIAEPLNLDGLLIGCPDPRERDVAFLEESHLGPLRPPAFSSLAPRPAAGVLMPHQMNSPEIQAACLPSSNGLMNARSIARHYAALLPGGVDGMQLLTPSTLKEATTWQTHVDPGGQPATWGLGYSRAVISWQGRTVEGFGHGGYGGSMGFAFPSLALAIGFTRNRLGPESGWPALITTLSHA